MEEATCKDPMKVSMSVVRGSSNKLKSLKLCGESLFPLRCHDNDNAKDKESAHNQCLASLFLGGTDQACYRAAVDELNNNYVLGKDVCPADVPAAIMVLTNRRGCGGSRQRQVEVLSDGLSVVSFAQQPGRRRGKGWCFR